MTRNSILALVGAAVVGILIFAFIEDQNDGPLENAAESVEDAADDMGDDIEDAADELDGS
ncbi:hypothetical protein [Hyphococcus sp.]|uniref:hypothetical protein n=1 Tax=Hyphococcus sp. TaxID=2038636 RepID=UPI0035C6F1C9